MLPCPYLRFNRGCNQNEIVEDGLSPSKMLLSAQKARRSTPLQSKTEYHHNVFITQKERTRLQRAIKKRCEQNGHDEKGALCQPIRGQWRL